jgi:hypothetical protein
MGHLTVATYDKIFERVARVQVARCEGSLVHADAAAMGCVALTGGGLSMEAVACLYSFVLSLRRPCAFECDVDHASRAEAETLSDEVQVVIVDPDCRKIVGDAQGYVVLSCAEAGDGFKPHLKYVFREETLEIAFYGFP